MTNNQINEASKLVSDIALELHRDSKMLIDECIERAAWGVLFATQMCLANEQKP